MKWQIFSLQKEPGFRFNVIDLLFILCLLALTTTLYLIEVPTALLSLIPYLGLSFFMFCNLFRIGNYLERFWYIPFTVIAVWGITTSELDMMWWIILLTLEPFKWILIVYRIFSGNYVGIGHRHLNKNL